MTVLTGRRTISGMEAATLPPPGEPSIGSLWWLPFTAGVLTVIVGLIALIWPGPSLLFVGVLLGGWLVVWGALTLARGIGAAHSSPVGVRIVLVLLGLLGVVAGLVLVVRPDASVATIAFVLGFWWTLMGVLQIVRGIAVHEERGLNLLQGAVGLVAGLVILAQPKIGLTVLMWVSGFGLLLYGTLEMTAGWRLRRLQKEGLA